MKIRNLFFCEDIREEVGGKKSAMGLLSDVINVNLPADGPETVPLQLAVLVTLENEGRQYKRVDLFSELFIDGGSIGQIKFSVELNKEGTLYYEPLPKFSLDVADSSDVTMKVKVLLDDAVLAQQEVTLQAQLIRRDDNI